MRSGILVKWIIAFYLCWLEHAAGECGAKDEGECEPKDCMKLNDTVDAVGILGMKILAEMSKRSDNNIAFSPLIIASAMAMMYAGAAGETEKQMKKVLKISKDYKNEYNALLGSSSSRQGVTLNVANSVFTEKCIKIEDDFESDVECYFKGKVIDADFKENPKNETKIINSWIKEKTNGTIKDLLSRNKITTNSSMALINAIYFQVFPKLKGDTPLKTYMESVMENKKEFLDQLDYTKMTIQMIRLLLPKFKIEASVPLRAVFKKIGMNLAFKEKKAEFTNLAKTDDVFISNAVHKAYIEVNETRTDKAPKNSSDIFAIKVNRPFMFFIKDEMTGVILLQGAVRDPKIKIV
ncbi:serpin B6 isoform X2 [Eurytemora carolleeae]|uniref:serpin B6 isoform X2 n=1 Tax=Eurytemora carolleeae TaxID=1294199 RepID=UPI000C7574A1|nr:serpin B6 isoform X2 [Eurytemora carolleeae]|eukprot:XP_023327449.1 serpin B6-like isoform X2 [Eurytemora affinis]